jgi:hypothetical protein
MKKVKKYKVNSSIFTEGEFIIGNTLSCVCKTLEEINGFNSIYEFERFQLYLSNLLNKKDFIKVEKSRNPKNYEIPKEFYKCNKCHCNWVLEYPDFPFKGSWKKAR